MNKTCTEVYPGPGISYSDLIKRLEAAAKHLGVSPEETSLSVGTDVDGSGIILVFSSK